MAYLQSKRSVSITNIEVDYPSLILRSGLDSWANVTTDARQTTEAVQPGPESLSIVCESNYRCDDPSEPAAPERYVVGNYMSTSSHHVLESSRLTQSDGNITEVGIRKNVRLRFHSSFNRSIPSKFSTAPASASQEFVRSVKIIVVSDYVSWLTSLPTVQDCFLMTVPFA